MLPYIVMISLSLSIDALGIGIVLALRKIKIEIIPLLVMALFSFTITQASLFIGKFLGLVLPEFVSRLISSFLLIFLGGFIIFNANKKTPQRLGESSQGRIFTFIIKSLGITIEIIRSPRSCDLDVSGKLDIKEALYLALVLSIDSFGIGIGSGMAGLYSYLIPFFTALSQTIFISIGGALIRLLNIKCKKEGFNKISGILLIAIGLLKLI